MNEWDKNNRYHLLKYIKLFKQEDELHWQLDTGKFHEPLNVMTGRIKILQNQRKEIITLIDRRLKPEWFNDSDCKV